MHKILIISILLSSCSLLHASTNINNININSINNIGENNTVNYYNKANYTISVDAFRITEKERYDFVKNYNKYPFLSSVNAQLLSDSLLKRDNNSLQEYAAWYFGEETFGMDNVINDAIEMNSLKDNKSLIKTLIWAVVDNYINFLEKCNKGKLKTIIIDILQLFADNNINKDYIGMIINNETKINELTNQLSFEIEKCNLYKNINAIIKGVNEFTNLHEKRINCK